MATDMVPMFVCMFGGCFLVSDWCGRFKVAFVIIPLDEGGYRVKEQIFSLVHEFATRCRTVSQNVFFLLCFNPY